MKYDVLVFDGPGVCVSSRSGLLTSLTAILAPVYTISLIDLDGVRGRSWAKNCALLVFPHCQDFTLYQSLDADRTAAGNIRQYVRGGGALVGICGAAYFTSAKTRFGQHFWEGNNLVFNSHRSVGPCLNDGPQTHEFIMPFASPQNAPQGDQAPYCDLFCDSGGEFVLDRGEPYHLLAQYATKSVAAIQCTHGSGRVAFWHPRFECSFLTEEVKDGHLTTLGWPLVDAGHIHLREARRFEVIERTLKDLGIIIPDIRDPPPLCPLPQILLISPYNPQADRIRAHISQNLGNVADTIRGERDDFILQPAHFATLARWESLRSQARQPPPPPNANQRLHNTWILSTGGLPNPSVTPFFNLELYFERLQNARSRHDNDLAKKKDPKKKDLVKKDLGDVVLYGEMVMSTQTQLNRNTSIANLLPSPLLSLATFQLHGVGRNRARWFSPHGVLQWSLLLDVPCPFNPQSLVYTLESITHLVSLAVVEACRKFLPPGAPSTLGLKWPNDIYANVGPDMLNKIGGVTVDVIPGSGPKHRVLIGSGLNVYNGPSPLWFLSQLAGRQLDMEEVAAEIMAWLSVCWYDFVQAGGSFDIFAERYRAVWLQRDLKAFIQYQVNEQPTKCTLLGIDSSGRLKVHEVRTQGHLRKSRDVLIASEDYRGPTRKVLMSESSV